MRKTIHRSFSPLAAHVPHLGLLGTSTRDRVQPRAYRLVVHDGTRSLHEHEKGRLKGVVGIVDVAQNAAADPENHRAVSAHERGERRFISLSDKPCQQLAIRNAGWVQRFA
jgi:hypothetical protein